MKSAVNFNPSSPPRHCTRVEEPARYPLNMRLSHLDDSDKTKLCGETGSIFYSALDSLSFISRSQSAKRSFPAIKKLYRICFYLWLQRHFLPSIGYIGNYTQRLWRYIWEQRFDLSMKALIVSILRGVALSETSRGGFSKALNVIYEISVQQKRINILKAQFLLYWLFEHCEKWKTYITKWLLIAGSVFPLSAWRQKISVPLKLGFFCPQPMDSVSAVNHFC